jgi:hypothetical protein
MALIGALVDKDAGGTVDLTGPQIALPSPYPDKAQIIEVDIAVVALPDVPKQDRLEDAVVRAYAKVHGHATTQLQLSNQSPVMCQAGISGIRTSDRGAHASAVASCLGRAAQAQ